MVDSSRGNDESEAAPSDFTEAALARRLTTSRFGRPHVHFAVCGSTNDELALRARTPSPVAAAAPAAPPAAAPEGMIVSADAQSRGRGRSGHAWHSPPGTNLYVSILLRPERPAIDIPPITLLAGGALARTVRRFGIDALVKWPNDLVVRAPEPTGPRFRKIAGILTEAATEAERVVHVVVGIGLNVNTTSFPDALADTATSLRQILGRPLSRVEVLARLLADFELAYEEFRERGASSAVALWETHAQLGHRCRARGTWGAVEGVAAGVGPGGELLIEDDHGIVHRVISGEVMAVA